MRKYILILPLLLGWTSYAQTDTSKIYGEHKDTLQTAVFTARQGGNYLSRGKDIRTEVISAAGLCKMACCNLAESFENSASVTVGYSDAVTGARQIRLLGQSGIYTQMLDENRPVMRGLAAPWGLNFVPSQWLESIQIAKGVTSVINGVESMTGQINMEHRKPTDEKPLYLQASYMNDTKADINLVSAFQFDELATWSTVVMAHADGNFKAMDMNSDGFMDDPRQMNLSLSNRWLYFGQDGVQVRFGVRAVQDRRNGGQMQEDTHAWKADILSRNLGGYVKVGIPLNEANTSNVAAVIDHTFYNLDSGFGTEGIILQDRSQGGQGSTIGLGRGYDAGQNSTFVNLLYQNQDNDSHHFTLGLSEMLDIYNERFSQTVRGMDNIPAVRTSLSDLGAFGEYTFHSGDAFSAIVGLRGDWYNQAGLKFSPRVTLKWSPDEFLTFRANGGRGIRYSTPIVDNIGILSTNKTILGDLMSHPLENSWTFGGNATWYIGGSTSNYLSVDYFGTRFTDQMLVDYTSDEIHTYLLSSVPGGRSRTDNLQVDFSIEPLPRFTVTLTGRFTDAHQSLKFQDDDIKPMTSRYKGVLNMQYATNLNRWIFDFTASVNGPCRVWDFMKTLDPMYKDGYTEVYPLLYAQVTKRFKGFDLYLGGENLTGYTQPDPIISADDPTSRSFDASCVWGPLMGVKVYGGIRLTIWKKE